MTNDEKAALLDIIQNCAFSTADAESYYNALDAAFPSAGNTDGLSTAVKNALLAIFQKAAYSTDDGQTYYDALYSAFFPPADVVSISAVFTQGGAVIYTSDSLDVLRQYLVVTATYEDATSRVVTDYTLIGTLEAGTSTITASYGGKTDTFNVTVSAHVPSGYITDGLIFFLDGKQNISANSWTDIIGNKAFALTNCILGTNGIVFDGSTSYGEYNGAVSSDWANETIEVVISYTGTSTDFQKMSLFNQALINNALGAGMNFGNNGSNLIRVCMAADGTTRALLQFTFNNAAKPKYISRSAAKLVVNGTESNSSGGSTSYGANSSGKTMLGARRTSGDPVNKFNGTIHAIRIYNKQLTVAEMKANQANDATYYGI